MCTYSMLSKHLKSPRSIGTDRWRHQQAHNAIDRCASNHLDWQRGRQARAHIDQSILVHTRQPQVTTKRLVREKSRNTKRKSSNLKRTWHVKHGLAKPLWKQSTKNGSPRSTTKTLDTKLWSHWNSSTTFAMPVDRPLGLASYIVSLLQYSHQLPPIIFVWCLHSSSEERHSRLYVMPWSVCCEKELVYRVMESLR